MFKRLHEPRAPVRFEFEGETVTAEDGDTVAAALLAHGIRHTRNAVVSGSNRAAHCMIGVCFECLVEIDGRPSRQACLTPVRVGMTVRRQSGPARVSDGAGE
jgi:predicted molibdopterin-dependent oxidoreductase YjgC